MTKPATLRPPNFQRNKTERLFFHVERWLHEEDARACEVGWREVYLNEEYGGWHFTLRSECGRSLTFREPGWDCSSPAIINAWKITDILPDGHRGATIFQGDDTVDCAAASKWPAS